ncbi:hypothetical protein [Nocardioides speluncae]|uniref:hypothetical protein n=1 Tax=Nocardioides speluncae TaxID=2670337 RepID=UPI000D69C4E2|nr:hypothetical protein [Nocardioides speluncae]
MPNDPLLDAADRLYGLPMAEFTPARDALAKELKGTDKDLSARVKALKKPSVAGWVVNLLVRREQEQVEQVLAVGEALREAQAKLEGEELRALTRQRRQLTSAVTARARAVAKEAGQRITDAVADQVEATLTAAMLDEGAAAAVRSGLLTGALSATGVDAVDVSAVLAVPEAAGFAASATAAPEVDARPELHVVPDPDADEKARRAAEERLAATEAELTKAQEAADAAAAEVKDLEAKSMQITSEIDELKRRLAELDDNLDQVDEELADAEDVYAEARATASTATKARDAAARALDKLS